ncbi:MAG: polysaccharide deacetylase family protein [Armatimonadetes bacterium]|nr:polysaccharide deacetylase family protein [Candidatus Hippobium faecium]
MFYNKIVFGFLVFLFICSAVYAERIHPEEYYNQANNVVTFLKEGNTTRSVSVLKEMTQTFGEDDFIRTAYAINMLIGKEYQEAERCFKYILSANDKDIFANYCMGLLCLYNKNTNEALTYFEKSKDKISDYKTLCEYIKVAENSESTINSTEEDTLNSIIFDGYRELRNGNFENARKFYDLVAKIKGNDAYIEYPGILLSYDFSQPVSFNGTKFGEALGLSVADRNKKETVSGRVTIRADLSKIANAHILLFYIDDVFKGMTNSSPSIVIDTVNYSNGLHDIRIDALDFENNLISSTNYSLDIFNKVTAPIFFDDNVMWDEMWNFIQVRPSQAAVNYLTAVCAAKTDDKAEHCYSLERCVACDPDYKDAKNILTSLYMNKKGRKSVERGSANSKKVCITFDDGPTKNTTEILDILQMYNAKATFFTVGKMAVKSPEIIRMMRDMGHQVALHSQNHLNLTRLDYYDLQKEILQGYCSVKSCGVEPSLYLRPPGGNLNPNINRLADDYGINIIMWTKNTTHLQQSSPEEMAQYCFNSLKPGFIYLMHNNEPVTVKALPMILSYFKSMGYECVTLEELLEKK